MFRLRAIPNPRLSCLAGAKNWASAMYIVCVPTNPVCVCPQLTTKAQARHWKYKKQIAVEVKIFTPSFEKFSIGNAI